MHYAAPRTVEEAVGLLSSAAGAAHVLAGGTDLVVQMGAGLRRPDIVVDVKAIDEMTRIAADAAGFHIGAAVCGAAIGEHAALRAAWPGVVEAVGLIGSMQVQSRATAAGNLCNGSPAADSVPAMIAAGATVTIAGPAGRRTVPVEAVPAGPGRTTLEKGEVVVAIHLPPRPPRTGDAYLRMIPRSEMDIAVVGAGVCLTLDKTGLCTAARVALGAVAPTAVLVEAAGAALVGTRIEADALEAAAAAARAACRPIDDKRGTAAYRTRVAGVMVRRAAAVALDRARA